MNDFEDFKHICMYLEEILCLCVTNTIREGNLAVDVNYDIFLSRHECTYCSKKFPTKWCLTDHVDWDHLKRIKYQCNVCFKASLTSSKHTVMIHINFIFSPSKFIYV